jgi:hypothetical protein
MKFHRITCLLLIFTLPCFAADAKQKIYTNKEYGFSLSYPEYLTTMDKFQQFYHLPVSWSADATTKKLPGQKLIISIPVASVHNKADGYYFFAAVRVGVSTNPKDVKDCYKLPEFLHESKATRVTINNQTYIVAAVLSAGMSQYSMGKTYRTVHDNKCYSLEYVDTGIDNALSRKLSQHYLPVMMGIVNSFRFD